MHHLNVDGVSWRILADDLETLIQQHVDVKSPRLDVRRHCDEDGLRARRHG